MLGSSSLWLRLLRAVECWLAVLSSDAADTPSLRGVMLGAEGESDFTAGPVAPVNMELWVRGSFQQLSEGTVAVRISQGSFRGAGRAGASLAAANRFHACEYCVLHLTSPQNHHRVAAKELQALQTRRLSQSKLL